jgi:hypothetical protein
MRLINQSSEQAVSVVLTNTPLSARKTRKTVNHVEPIPDMFYVSESSLSHLETEAALPKVSKNRKTARPVEPMSPLSSEGSDQTSCGYVATHLHSDTIDRVTYLWRQRQRWHRAEKSLILQGKALCRAFVEGGDKTVASKLFDDAQEGKADIDLAIKAALEPFFMSIQNFSKPRAVLERQIEKLAKTLPGASYVASVHGFGFPGYGGLIGEAGDLTKYRSVAALWKRMGVAVIGDGRQRKISNAEDALVHGYSPSRRSHLWNIGNGVIGGMGRGKRPSPGEDISLREDWTEFQKLFVERCRYECDRDPVKFPLATVTDKKTGEIRESYPKHVQSRAKRYVEKRLLRKLYAEWRREIYGVSGDPDDAV